MRHAFFDSSEESERDAIHQDEAEAAELEGPDQRSLEHTGACKTKPGEHQGFKVFSDELFLFPTTETLTEGETATFVHITNTGRAKRIDHGLIKKWMTKIGVPEGFDAFGEEEETCAKPDLTE